jgi:DNA-binding response OmpR family regulator
MGSAIEKDKSMHDDSALLKITAKEDAIMEKTAKILVVDDEVRICHNVKKILAKNNFEVTSAQSAQEALDKMAKESYSLVISDMVMPGMNGLELLKLVKNEWPVTKAIMMTAYASTNTAVKAIQLGALDYIPKPFTPEELRNIVDQALAGNIVETPASEAEREAINIDIDIPFDSEEVAKYTGEDYVKTLGPSDMPVVEVKPQALPEHFCELGDMVCDIFKKLGATCKIGVKKNLCPQLAKKAKAEAADAGADVRTLIGIDMPFNYDEVAAVTGPEYINSLRHDGVAMMYYSDLKENVVNLMKIKEAEQSAPRTGMQEAPFTRNILVIDDEAAVNNNIRKILAKKGYHVDQALTKAEALEKIHAGSYKLFVLDLKIPDVKGLELLETIRGRHPEAKVIIITGYASIETAVESSRMGITDYLNKPFTPDEIRNATENAMRFAA